MRRFRPDHAIPDPYLSPERRPEPKEGAAQFRLARADESVDAEDLTTPHLEAYVAERAFAVAQSARGQPRLRSRLRPRTGPPHDLAPYHGADDVVGVRVADRLAPDTAPVAKDGDIVGNREDFVETMGHEQHRAAPLGERANVGEQSRRLPRRKSRGRFVEDQDVGMRGERERKLHPLLFRLGQIAYRLRGIEGPARGLQNSGGAFLEATPGNASGPGPRVTEPEPEVVGHRKIGNKVRVLMHDGNAHPRRGGVRVARAVEAHRRSADLDRAFVRGQQAREDPDEGGLARPVLADDRMDRPRLERDVHAVERENAGIALRQAAGLQKNVGHRGRCL